MARLTAEERSAIGGHASAIRYGREGEAAAWRRALRVLQAKRAVQGIAADPDLDPEDREYLAGLLVDRRVVADG